MEDLFRLLYEVSVHLNANIVATSMGHFKGVNNSRFIFSHNFNSLLLSQLEDYIDDIRKNISFQIKISNNRVSKKKMKLPEFWASGYVRRPEEL